MLGATAYIAANDDFISVTHVINSITYLIVITVVNEHFKSIYRTGLDSFEP